MAGAKQTRAAPLRNPFRPAWAGYPFGSPLNSVGSTPTPGHSPQAPWSNLPLAVCSERMQRISSFFPPLALLLALGALGACGDGGGGKKEPLDAGDDGGEAVVDEPDASGEGDSEPPCVPKGCDEQGFECGTAEDGCGNPLDCTGVKECRYPEICGPEHRCVCIPQTCEDLASSGGARACGSLPDGCGGDLDCGGCDGFDGDRWTCSTGICECPAASKETACAAKTCGTATDGCGAAAYDCGSCSSAARECSDAGSCVCRERSSAFATTACAGKTCGSVTVDGCEFDCGGACPGGTCGAGAGCSACECAGGLLCGATGTCCTPSTQTALCRGQPLGATVTDGCTGQSYACTCPAGQTPVDRLYVEGASESRCVDNSEAALLGGYVVRTHSFQDFITGLQRAETVSRVRIVRTRNGSLQVQDTGCVATTTSQDANTRSVAPAYFNIPTNVASFTIAPSPTSAFARTADRAEPAGFFPGMPTYCTPGATPAVEPDFPAYSGTALVDTPTPSSGSVKKWLTANKGLCTCPALGVACAGEPNDACLPPDNTSQATNVTDCRVNDVDGDNRPGFTAIALTVGTSTVATAASAGKTVWNSGRLNSQRFHVAEAPADPNFAQAFLSCSDQLLGVACRQLDGDKKATPCRSEFNLVQFAPLTVAQDAAFDCRQFYTPPLSTVAAAVRWSDVQTAVRQSAIEAYFNGTNTPLPACSATAECTTGMTCRSGRCFPKTAANSCASDSDCGAGWTCRDSLAAASTCWPTDLATCRAR
jgi:hypothetical protein